MSVDFEPPRPFGMPDPDDDWGSGMSGIVFRPGERPKSPSIEAIREARRQAGLPIHTVNPWAKQSVDAQMGTAQEGQDMGIRIETLEESPTDALAELLVSQRRASN